MTCARSPLHAYRRHGRGRVTLAPVHMFETGHGNACELDCGCCDWVKCVSTSNVTMMFSGHEAGCGRSHPAAASSKH
eukprot:9368892-Heterocapsa_arctica.AAC.1